MRLIDPRIHPDIHPFVQSSATQIAFSNITQTDESDWDKPHCATSPTDHTDLYSFNVWTTGSISANTKKSFGINIPLAAIENSIVDLKGSGQVYGQGTVVSFHAGSSSDPSVTNTEIAPSFSWGSSPSSTQGFLQETFFYRSTDSQDMILWMTVLNTTDAAVTVRAVFSAAATTSLRN